MKRPVVESPTRGFTTKESPISMVRPTKIERVTFARRGRTSRTLNRQGGEEFEIDFVRRGIGLGHLPRPRADEDCGRVAEQIDVQVKSIAGAPSTAGREQMAFRSDLVVTLFHLYSRSAIRVVLKAACKKSWNDCALSRNQSRILVRLIARIGCCPD